jgi:hypothetical protein
LQMHKNNMYSNIILTAATQTSAHMVNKHIKPT